MAGTGQIIEILRLSERLKFELRHSWLSNGRRESVAEHCWQMALMALLTYRHLEYPIEIEKVLKMILIHDLVEAEAGDIPFFEVGTRKQQKAALEQQAIAHIRDMLPGETGQEIFDLFQEFETGKSVEAKFAKALDNLEVQIQHNFADIATWEAVEYGLVYTKMDPHCEHDSFLRDLCAAIKRDGEAKMVAAKVDVNAVKQNITPKSNRP